MCNYHSRIDRRLLQSPGYPNMYKDTKIAQKSCKNRLSRLTTETQTHAVIVQVLDIDLPNNLALFNCGTGNLGTMRIISGKLKGCTLMSTQNISYIFTNFPFEFTMDYGLGNYEKRGILLEAKGNYSVFLYNPGPLTSLIRKMTPPQIPIPCR